MAKKVIANRVYLLLGPENGLKHEWSEELIKKFKHSCHDECEEFTFYPYDTDFSIILGELTNLSLFTSFRIISIFNLEDFKPKEISQLGDGISHLNETTLLLLYSQKTTADRKLTSYVSSERKRIFWELNASQKQNWIHRYLEKHDTSITNGAIEMLLDLIDNTTEQIATTCDALIQKRRGDRIDEDTVVALIDHSKGESIFNQFQKIFARNITTTLEVTRSLQNY